MVFWRGSVEFNVVDGLIVRVGEGGVSGRVSILMNLLINFHEIFYCRLFF